MPLSRICLSARQADRSRYSFQITSAVAAHRAVWTNVRAMVGRALIFRANSQIKGSALTSSIIGTGSRCSFPKTH
jgi:hypothetical protein